jgi:hypothetical protein
MFNVGNQRSRFSFQASIVVIATLLIGFSSLNCFAAGPPEPGLDPNDDSAIPVDDPFLPVIRLLNEGGMIYPGRNEGIPVAEGTIASSLNSEEVMDRLIAVCQTNGYSYHRSGLTGGLSLGFLNVKTKEGKRTFLLFRTPNDNATIVKFSIELPNDFSGQQTLIDRFPELGDLAETLKDQKETFVPGAATATLLYEDSFLPEMALINADNILERAGWRHVFGDRELPKKLEMETNLFYKDQFVLWLHVKAEDSGRTFMVCQVMQQGETDVPPELKNPREHRPVIKAPEAGAEQVLP